MALKVWLPLNKNIKNYGLGNISLTNNGALLSNEGIFYNCYTFGNNKTISGVIDINASPISVALWVNLESFHDTWNYLFSLNNNSGYADQCIALCLESESTVRFCAGGNSNLKYTNSSSLVGKWTHIAITFNGSKICGYINGSLVCSSNSTANLKINNLTLGCRNGAANYYTNCKMNDVRVYDNCITDDDVKRIYQRKMYELVPYSGSKNVLFDRSGYCFMPMVNNGAVFNANSLYFDGGASTRLRPQNGNIGFGLTEGTLSIWFKPISKPSDYRILVIDSTSKMAIGFYNSGNHFLLTSNTSSKAFSSASIKYGELNNIIVGYTSNVPQYCIINGVAAAKNGGSSKWSETGGFTIGGRTYNNLNFNGTIYKVELHKKSLTSDEAIELYNSERGMFLPDDYIQLEYIESTGTQWIDTGIKGHMNYTYEIEFQQTDTGNYRNWGVFGQSSYVGPNMSLTYASGFALRWENLNNNQSLINSISSINTNKHFVKIVNGQLYWDGVNKGKSVGHKNDFVINYNLFLGTVNPGGTTPSANAKSKYYLYKVYDENGILIQNFIPSKRKSDSVIGMYDMVSRQFFTNSGTGSFTGA